MKYKRYLSIYLSWVLNLFKVSNRNTRGKSLRSFIANFEQIYCSDHVLLLLTLNMYLFLAPCILYPANTNMFKVNNRSTRTRCEICSKLTIILLTSKIFHTLFQCVHCQMKTTNCQQGIFQECPTNKAPIEYSDC